MGATRVTAGGIVVRCRPDHLHQNERARWLNFSGSTSGVEQQFTVGQVAVTDGQNPGPLLEYSYHKVIVDAKRDNPKVAAAA
eukprot:NODE_3187_length_817_cov_400.356955.p4 GENE.NODE_3187_length_817_cov_400.356955~~NODE_3187_length_817_cov_400.356955.p4  ORF type:complete len:82 (+),score=16.67 NODE_3187_length_817_cov_400.356955:3-248(+)